VHNVASLHQRDLTSSTPLAARPRLDIVTTTGSKLRMQCIFGTMSQIHYQEMKIRSDYTTVLAEI
jgi:hypothetical protein